MFYGSNIEDTRQVFYKSWDKYRQKQALLPLEQQVVAVILDHPEYHALFDQKEPQLEQPYFPELGQTNPFLHLGLHLAVREQITTNRPTGIADVYQRLLKKYNDRLVVEHLLIENLAECLWLAQRQQNLPDEQQYLQLLQHLALEKC